MPFHSPSEPKTKKNISKLETDLNFTNSCMTYIQFLTIQRENTMMAFFLEQEEIKVEQ